MKLYIKQKVFTFRDEFTVKDEFGTDRYFARGEYFSIGKRLHICDTVGTERIYIKQKLLSFLPRFCIFFEGREVAEVVKEFTFLKPRYRIEGLNWEVEGDWGAHNYRILRDGQMIASIHKEMMSWGDSYCVNVQDRRDEQMALAVVLAIDCAVAVQDNAIEVST